MSTTDATIKVTVRLNEEQVQRTRALASNDGVTLNDIFNTALALYIEAHPLAGQPLPVPRRLPPARRPARQQPPKGWYVIAGMDDDERTAAVALG